MEDNLKILIIEDLSSDAELLERELKTLEMPCETRLVDDEEGLKRELESFRPDLVLADYMLPRYSGMEALRLVNSTDPMLPIIIVTGSMNELTAVDCMKAGAWDYCIKERLSRLVPAIKGALEKRRLLQERSAAINALERNEKQFRLLIRQAPVAIAITRDRRLCYVNDMALALSGAGNRSELIGKNVIDFIKPAYMSKARHRLHRLMQGRAAEQTGYHLVTIDGREREVELSSVPIRFEGKKAFMSIINDVTENKELLQRYETVISNSSDAIFLAHDGSFEFVNPKFQEMFGYSLQEIRRPDFGVLSIAAPECHGRLAGKLDEVRKGGKADSICDFIGVTRDGRRLFCESSVSFLEYKGRHCILGIIRDRSEQRRAEEEIRKLSTAIEQNPISIVITDAEGNIEYVNPAFSRITGYSAEEVAGQNPRVLKSGQTPDETFEDLWATIQAKKVWTGEFINRRKDGAIFYERATISPILDMDGKISHFLAMKEDITGERELEKRVRQAQKMEAIGTLAGGIAHDFNNILLPIMGYSELSSGLIPEGTRLRSYISEIQSAAERARDLVSQILTFSRQGPVERNAVNVVPIIKETLKLLRAAIPSSIKMQEEIHCTRAVILGDPVEIHQVIMNLCVNAQHAMPEGGILTVVVRESALSGAAGGTAGGLEQERVLEILVKDTGCGINRQHLHKIFEPYFTTKEKGRGTGLGLAVVHGIVTSCNGTIEVQSEAGKGTEFRIRLNIIEADKATHHEFKEGFDMGTGEKILLVDDEPLIVQLGTEMLEQAGYQVTGFMDPEDALAAFKKDPDAFDLIITDMTMPVMTGDRLSKAILETRPDKPVLICTGYSEHMDPEKAKRLGIRGFLQKPFSPVELSKAVKDALEGTETG